MNCHPRVASDRHVSCVQRQKSQHRYNGGIKGTGVREWVLSATAGSGVVHGRLILFVTSVVEQAAIYSLYLSRRRHRDTPAQFSVSTAFCS